MAESTAWLLPLQGAWRAAVGEWELVHLIEAPVLVDIPVTPFYCRQVLLWENRILPVLDLAVWLAGQPLAPRDQMLAGIFAYQAQSEAALSYGILLLDGVPTRQVVRDEEACALAKSCHFLLWRQRQRRSHPGFAVYFFRCFVNRLKNNKKGQLYRIVGGGLADLADGERVTVHSSHPLAGEGLGVRGAVSKTYTLTLARSPRCALLLGRERGN